MHSILKMMFVAMQFYAIDVYRNFHLIQFWEWCSNGWYFSKKPGSNHHESLRYHHSINFNLFICNLHYFGHIVLMWPLHSEKQRCIGSICMENVGLGLIFVSKMSSLMCLWNQIFKCLPCGNIDVFRYAEIGLYGSRGMIQKKGDSKV